MTSTETKMDEMEGRRIYVTNRIARTLRQSGLGLTPGSSASEAVVRTACRTIAEKRTRAVYEAVANAPSGASVAVHGFRSMPEGRVFWASRIKGTTRFRIQSEKNVNSVFTTATGHELRDGSIHVFDWNRSELMHGLEASYDADLARREASLLRACGLEA